MSDFVPCDDVIESLKTTARLFRASKIIPRDADEAVYAEFAYGMMQMKADHLERAAVWLESHGWSEVGGPAGATP